MGVMGKSVSELGGNIMVIYQDSSGNHWFGSWESGVYRYDGKQLLQYTVEQGLPSNRVDEIHEDGKGHLYFVSCHPHSTVAKFDGKTFQTLQAVPSRTWHLDATDLWMRHAFGQEKVLRYDGVTLHALELPRPPHLSHISFEVYCIERDSQGHIWLGTNPLGVCRFNGEALDWITEEDVTEFRNEGANGVRSMIEDHRGFLWFNTEQRYEILDTVRAGEKFYTRHKGIGGLDGAVDSRLSKYLSAVRDAENNLWFVTYRDGVWKYDGLQMAHFDVQELEQSIQLYSISIDHNGKLWLGTQENGAYWFDGTTFVPFRPPVAHP
jgi:ligand-binding sensor domain-containing protein